MRLPFLANAGLPGAEAQAAVRAGLKRPAGILLFYGLMDQGDIDLAAGLAMLRFVRYAHEAKHRESNHNTDLSIKTDNGRYKELTETTEQLLPGADLV